MQPTTLFNYALPHLEILETLPELIPFEAAHPAHDFLIQNIRPDLVNDEDPDQALRLIDFP